MNANDISGITERQRALFAAGTTLERDYRDSALGALYRSIKSHEKDIAAALLSDLGKSEAESYMCETGMVLSSISYLRRNLSRLMRPRRTRTGMAQFPAHGELRYVPYGTALIIAPWNYPILLSLEPLADAIAAGNTVVLKPSATAPATAEVVAGIVRECFTEDYVCVVTGGREENADLLSMRWDKIFFTGSAATGKAVMRAASEHLTSVTLELGGKSPVIVDSTADIALTAKRLTYGKLLNCGQTCVAPDYVLCDERVHGELVEALRREMAAQVPDALHDPTYGRMAGARHFERVRALIDPAKLVYGGGCDADTLKIEPTILDGVSPDDAVMGEEIFGPVLPVLTYGSLEEAVAFVESRPRPLALYLFTSSRENKRYVLSRCRFGGGCVNDCIMHLTTHSLPFGGMGASGTGAYHGRWGFEAFSHLEGILHRGTACDPALRYRPFTEKKLSMIRRVMR